MKASFDEQLQPCPFCGGQAVSRIQSYETTFSEPFCYLQVGCASCGVFFTTHHYPIINKPKIPDWDMEDCVKAWNRRGL